MLIIFSIFSKKIYEILTLLRVFIDYPEILFPLLLLPKMCRLFFVCGEVCRAGFSM